MYKHVKTGISGRVSFITVVYSCNKNNQLLNSLEFIDEIQSHLMERSTFYIRFFFTKTLFDPPPPTAVEAFVQLHG